MAHTAAPAAYPAFHRLLHWLTALFVLTTIPAGLIMVQEGLPRSLGDALFLFHKNIGVVILLLVLARLVWRATHTVPPLPASVAHAQALVAHLVHGLLYLLLIGMAVSGYVRVAAGGFPLEALDALGLPRLAPRSDPLAERASDIHNLLRYPLIALIALHLAGALYHGLVRRDGVLSRMLPSSGR